MLFLVAIFSLLSSTAHADHNRHNYLDLMKKCLMNSIYQDPNSSGIPYHAGMRENGLDWPSVAHTMIGLHRLDNLQFCVEDVLQNNIPGDLIETGVWRGGASIFMRAILKAYDNTEKRVFVADSFEGLPVPNVELYPVDAVIACLADCKELAVSLPQVQINFSRYGLLDEQVVFLKGWFCDTLPTAPVEKLAVMRLDGDYYGSTMEALVNLYPKLSIGGYVIIDDYQIWCCAQAVHDFRDKMGITDELIPTADKQGAYWKRTK
ncbi:MAG: TylF/MycF family methyltransferase [Candidatus Babeliales bacterium]|jgi:hypothetical protein